MHILSEITDRIVRELKPLRFKSPVAYVYNPLEYARKPYDIYVERFGGPKEIVLVGMNPGPFGMAQTGVPFGDVSMVKDWLGIEEEVGKPVRMHPKRPVQGFRCMRGEVSGQRLWGWARDRFNLPEKFFTRFFVANYCPLLFLEESGRNLTPDKLRAGEKGMLFSVCNRGLAETIKVLMPKYVIGIGRFAAGMVEEVLKDAALQVGCITHPSPANPKANRGWAETVEEEFRAMGITLNP
jgi:single-strand selective monofunctional uracil DNA glycosylase